MDNDKTAPEHVEPPRVVRHPAPTFLCPVLNPLGERCSFKPGHEPRKHTWEKPGV